MPNTFTDNPQASHTLANDQPNIQNNFRYIQGALGKDHQIVFNDSDTGTTFEGRHISVSLKDNGASPAFPGDGTDSFVWSHNGNLFYRTTTSGPFQFTTTATGSNFGGAATVGNSVLSGWTFLPGGLIMNYGKVDSPSGSSTAVTFSQNFPTAILNVMLTPSRNNSNDKVVAVSSGSPGVNGFTISYSSSDRPTSIYWVAIGN